MSEEGIISNLKHPSPQPQIEDHPLTDKQIMCSLHRLP
jgi:hypothetical protein